MSKLAQFLKSTAGAANSANPANLDNERSHVPRANPANPANPDDASAEISNFSNISRGVMANSLLPDDLERRIRTMAARWGYTADELTEALAGAQSDPRGWLLWTERDERDFGHCVTPADFAGQYARIRGLA